MPVSLVSGADGGAYLAAIDSTNRKSSYVLQIDPSGKSILGRIAWDGVARSMAIDSFGRVYVAGARGTTNKRS